ncbi:MAG: PepSY-like domain-containing protein [Bacteroidota bacterium]
MRNFIICLAIVTLSCSLYAQNTTLPDVVSKAFEQKFPKAKKVKWSSENIDDYQAEFVSDSLNARALFSPKGEWLQTSVDVAQTKLTPATHQYIKKQYPKQKIQKVSKIDTLKKDPYFEIELKKGEELDYIYFNLTGEEIAPPK